MQGRVLIIAGSDSSGGAGIQADIKTVTALGGYAMTAITALTAQNTVGVQDIYPVPPQFVRQQIDSCLNDIGADVIKTGMLPNAEIMDAVVDAANDYPGHLPLVIDPVMISKSGARLMDESAIQHMKKNLLPRANILTPNIPEAEILTGTSIKTPEDMEKAARILLEQGPIAVLIKGGHLPTPVNGKIFDLWAINNASTLTFPQPYIKSKHTHGTGCTLASAIAVSMAQDFSPIMGILRAQKYVQEAIRTAPGFGHGSGPLNHAWTIPEDIKNPEKKIAQESDIPPQAA